MSPVIPPEELAQTGGSADSTGRATREEYWGVVFFNFITFLCLNSGHAPDVMDVIVGLFQLVLLILGIIIGVQRMHDTGHSGWWLLVPIVGLVFALQGSQPGSNRYGPSPKKPSGRYGSFKGRASKMDFWLFIFANFMVIAGLAEILRAPGELIGLVELVFFLIPSITTAVRRMHDTGHSGWWLLVPVVNLVFALQGSQPGNNRYGPELPPGAP